ncbi:hypothetical protein QQM39_40155 [Streptomyces sp. DT2A-34]|uniref:hypothetical protein n=1 Tax=Streptomyces sp. DT2A-34 TaxID=3051182 RepID=UPI00265B853C|nr:hypothetical protein [Streptomyces sp. DT2A-34]MDO0916806.1 hypothetical protein [Streptomyces sp. DT2A-34]
MYDDFGAPVRRRARRTAEAEELAYFARELEGDGAYVSPGRTPWRGLSGHDPLDDVPDDEFGERQFEDWHDAAYDEGDPDRPQRRRPSGRETDIVPPVVGEVTVRVDPAIAAAFAARQAEAGAGPSWPVDGGRVTVEGAVKTWRGPCLECGREFTQRRPVSQRRRWRWLCSDECFAARRRTAARERMRAVRSANAA